MKKTTVTHRWCSAKLSTDRTALEKNDEKTMRTVAAIIKSLNGTLQSSERNYKLK